MAHLIDVESKLEVMTCATCGMQFAAPEHWLDKHCREQGLGFNCPAGHSLTFGKGTVAKLQDDLALQKQRREQADAAAEQARAERDLAQKRLKRTKQRVGAGSCPCCKRHFSALSRHMACKHPEYREGAAS